MPIKRALAPQPWFVQGSECGTETCSAFSAARRAMRRDGPALKGQRLHCCAAVREGYPRSHHRSEVSAGCFAPADAFSMLPLRACWHLAPPAHRLIVAKVTRDHLWRPRACTYVAKEEEGEDKGKASPHPWLKSLWKQSNKYRHRVKSCTSTSPPHDIWTETGNPMWSECLLQREQ